MSRLTKPNKRITFTKEELILGYEGQKCPFCKENRSFTSEWWMREHLALNHFDEMVKNKKRRVLC